MSSPPKKLRKNAAAAAAAASADIIEHRDANADDDMNEDPSTMYEDEEGASVCVHCKRLHSIAPTNSINRFALTN